MHITVKRFSAHFDDVWSEEYLRNCCWMVSFYTLDALFSLGSSGRFNPDKRMFFSRRELEKFLVEGIGLAIGSFLREQASASLIAVAVRQALGHLYDNLLQRYAVRKGFYYHRTWVQEAVYVIEKKGKKSGEKPDKRSPQPGRRCEYSEGDYAIECEQNA